MILVSEKFGTHLGSRVQAGAFRATLMSEAGPIVLDFSGVEVVGHAFADELFGKLAEELGKDIFRDRFQLKNLSPENRALVKAVIRNRLDAKAVS